MFNRLFRVCFLAALIMAFTLPNSVYAQKPIFKEVSVHDPSIIETNGTFYVFGSILPCQDRPSIRLAPAPQPAYFLPPHSAAGEQTAGRSDALYAVSYESLNS